MAYFNHAFVKCFAPTAIDTGGTKTIDLAQQQIGVVDAKSWATIDPGTLVPSLGAGQAPVFHLVQGSYYSADKIGSNPGHGGYTESIKSKLINLRYVNRIYSTECVEPQPASATLSVASDCVPCGEILLVRLDVKGSPALRFLNHNAYATGDSGNICCTAEDQDYVDPASALVAAVSEVISDPVVAPFAQIEANGIAVTVGGVTTNYADVDDFEANYTPSTDPVGDGVTASITLQGAYVDTKFGNCSFDTRDHYEKEPVSLILSAIDETGDPCSDCGTSESTPGLMGQTYGDTVLRGVLMSENYRQSPYNQGNADSARIREIEGSDLVLAAVPRFDANGDPILYKEFGILHSVPRFNNPTGVFDNDQYLYKVYAPCGSTLEDDLNDMFGTIAKAASEITNGAVQYEQNIDRIFL